MKRGNQQARPPAPVRSLRAEGALARLLDAAPLGMLVAARDGEALYANRAFTALMGYALTPETRLNLMDLVHPDDSAAARLQLQRLARGEASAYRGEHRFRHADGSPLWVMVAASLLEAAADDPAVLIVQLTNIELQKKAEEALAYSESRWNFALESARQGVWDHDIRTDTMFYSRMWRIMRGIPPDEPVGRDHQDRWLSRIHPDDLPHVLANIHRQDQGDADFDALEYRERTRDGSYIWILSRGRPVEWDADGNPVRTLGTDTDITRLKTMEMELAAEKERLRVTLEAMADGMISTDTAGAIVFMNPAAEQLTGVTAAAARGRPVGEVFRLTSEATGAPRPCPVTECLERQAPVSVEDDGVLTGPGGTRRDIRCTASPVTMPGGRLSGAVLVFQDVTQSRTLQRQLAHSAAHDGLTGLPNRAAFERALSAAIASARDGPRRHSLLYIDLDRFKPVNDTAGHAAGDALLKQVAQTIKGACRRHDLAARIGGDEFAVILEDCSLENGRQVAHKVVRAIAALAFVWAGREYRIGASIGLTLIGQAPASPLGFMGEADAACYAAKADGRGRVVAYQDMRLSSDRH